MKSERKAFPTMLTYTLNLANLINSTVQPSSSRFTSLHQSSQRWGRRGRGIRSLTRMTRQPRSNGQWPSLRKVDIMSTRTNSNGTISSQYHIPMPENDPRPQHLPQRMLLHHWQYQCDRSNILKQLLVPTPQHLLPLRRRHPHDRRRVVWGHARKCR
jgi:hypothetical protein